jgi:hydroxypyruvate isomerase
MNKNHKSKLKFAPNLTWLFKELPFLDRFDAAANAGFNAVELLFPYEAGIDAVKARLNAAGLHVALFNTPPGNVDTGEFGLLAAPSRRNAFRRDFEIALDAAQRLNCARLHVMAGKQMPDVSRQAQLDCALENLAWAAPLAETTGVTLLIESLNPVDVPDYLLLNPTDGLNLVEQANWPNVKMQFDVYHAQMTQGNLINTITSNFARIGHIQIADVPGRCQPGCGEINYPAVFRTLTKLDYDGYIGLEYKPVGSTLESLVWLDEAE